MRVWVRDDSKNLIAGETLGLINYTLSAGPIFGYWYRAQSESGPNFWLARDYAQFTRVVAQAYPGDYYVIWSLPALLQRGLALAAARHADVHTGRGSLLSADGLAAVEDFVSDGSREYLAIFYSLYGIPEVSIGGRDGLESLVESAQAYNKQGGEGYVFPFTRSYSSSSVDGQAVTIERPAYWLVVAQFPNERGEVLIEREE